MSKTKRASFTKPTLLVAAGVLATLLASACSDDGDTTNSGAGAKAGSGGTGATAGTGGRGGTSGGGTGGRGGTGATTGTGGTTGRPGDSGPDTGDSGPDTGDSGPNDSGPDGSDGGCPTGQVLRYEAPGCTATPRCGLPIQDACLGYACSCRGTLLTGCDYFTEPYVSRGMCSEGSVDSGGG